MEESVLKLIETGTDGDISLLLKQFNEKYESQFTPVGFEADHCRRFWSVLFEKLNRDISTGTFHQICLTTLRILSRDKLSVNEVVDDEKLSIIVRLARLVTEEEALEQINYQVNYDVVTEAQKCLSNLVFNSSKIQRLCCDNSCIPGLMCRLKSFRDPDLPAMVKQYDMRLLFFITACCADIRPCLRSEYHGLTYLIEVLDVSRQTALDEAELLLPEGGVPRVVFQDEALDLVMEVLKVLYNLVVHLDRCNPDEEEEEHCLRLVGLLRSLLLAEGATESRTEELHSHTLNLLLMIPPQMYEELLLPMPVANQSAAVGAEGGVIERGTCEYDGKDMSAIMKTLEFLHQKLRVTKQLKELLLPIMTLMVEMVQVNRTIRKFLRLQVLPPLRDVTRLPEEGDTVRNKLCGLMTSPNHDLKILSASFLFILCKENVNRLVKYTGYGNAAGLLAARGLMLEGRNPTAGVYSSDSEDSETEEYGDVKNWVNPVTGRFEPRRPSPMAGMTEEQKEHETMKLVDAIDKLTSHKIIVPCRVGADGKPHPIENVAELQRGMREAAGEAAAASHGENNEASDSDS